MDSRKRNIGPEVFKHRKPKCLDCLFTKYWQACMPLPPFRMFSKTEQKDKKGYSSPDTGPWVKKRKEKGIMSS